jgi:hypothetical protein
MGGRFRRFKLCEWTELGGGWGTECESSCCTGQGCISAFIVCVCVDAPVEWRKSDLLFAIVLWLRRMYSRVGSLLLGGVTASRGARAAAGAAGLLKIQP